MKKRLGELLVEAGLITEKMVDEALVKKKTEQKLGDYLVEQGLVVEDMLYSHLSRQLQIPLFSLQEIEVDVRILDKIPRKILLQAHAFPVELTGSLLSVAMSDPLDDNALALLNEHADYDVTPVLATKSDISDYLGKYYNIDHSLSDLFGDRTYVGDDMTDLQVADLFYALLHIESHLQIVISESMGITKIIEKNISKISETDAKYILGYLKKVVGYTDNKSNYTHQFNLSNGEIITVKLSVLRNHKDTHFWIYCSLSEMKNVADFYQNMKLLDLQEPGIYVLHNPKFQYSDALIGSILGLHTSGTKVLLHTEDSEITIPGVTKLSTSISNLPNFIDFAEVFVLDYGWEITDITALIRLLKAKKKIVLHVPFGTRDAFHLYLEHLGLANLLEPFVVSHVFLD